MPIAGFFSSVNKDTSSKIKISQIKSKGNIIYEYIIDPEINQDDFYEIAFFALQNTILSSGKNNISQIFSQQENTTNLLHLTKPQHISNNESSAINYDLTYVYNYLFLYSGGNTGTDGNTITNYTRDANFSTFQTPYFNENDWKFIANSDLVNLTIKNIDSSYSIPNSLEGISVSNKDSYLNTYNNKDKYWWNQQIDKQRFILHSTDGSIKYTIQRICDWTNKKITINITYNYLNTIDYREDNFYNYYVNNNPSIFGTQYDINTKKNILYDLGNNDLKIRKNYHFTIKNDGLYDIFTFLDYTNAAKQDIGSSETPVSTASVCKTSKNSIKANKSQSLTIYKKDFQLDQHDPNNNYKKNNVLGIGLSIAKDLFHHGDKELTGRDVRNNISTTTNINDVLAYYNQIAAPKSSNLMTDIGPNNNNGTIVGNITEHNDYLEWNQQAYIDTNISFQDIYDINGTGEYTLAAKIQYTGTDSQTYSAIFGGKEDNGGTEFFIGKTYGNTSLGLQDSEFFSSYISNPDIFNSTGRSTSHTIIQIRTGTPGNYIHKTYIDGSEITPTNSAFSGVNTSEKIVIGSEVEGNGYHFTGKIWQAIILKKAINSNDATYFHNTMINDEILFNSNSIIKQVGTINASSDDNNTISFYNVSNTPYPIKILFKNIPGDFLIDNNNKLNVTTNNSPNIISLKIMHENNYYVTLSFLSTQSKGIQFLIGYNQKQNTNFFENPSIILDNNELTSMTFSKVFGNEEITNEKDAEIDIFPYVKEFLPFYNSTQDPINFIIRRTYLWNSETKTKDYSQNTWEFIPLFHCKYLDVWYSHPNKNLDICYFYYKNHNISSPNHSNLDIINTQNLILSDYPMTNIHSSVIIGGFIERNNTNRIIVNNSLYFDSNLPDYINVDFNNHLYFGWAPTSTSNNNYWEPKELKLFQNGIDIIDNSPIVYLLDGGRGTGSYSGPPGTNDNLGNWHFVQYGPPNWYTFWDNKEYGYRPVLYRKIENRYSLDGSPLTALQKCRPDHIPDSGWILSAETPDGPWYVRGEWLGQKNNNNIAWTEGFTSTINSTGTLSPDISLNLYIKNTNYEYHKDPIYHPYNSENFTNEFTWNHTTDGLNSENPGQGNFYKIIYNANESKLYFYDKIHRSVMWKPRENSETQKWNLLHTQDICFNDIDNDEIYLKVFMSHGSQRILLNWREALSGTNMDGSNVTDNNVSNNELNVAFHSYKIQDDKLIYENNIGYNIENNVLIDQFNNDFINLSQSNKLYNNNNIIKAEQYFIESERSELIYNWIFSHKDINISNLNEESLYGIVIPGLNLNNLMISLYQYYSVYQYANRTQDIDVDVDTSTNYISRVNEIKFTKLDNFPQDYTGFDSLSHLISNVNNTANIDYSDLSNFDNIFPILSITLPNDASIHNVNLLNIHKNLFNIKRLQNSNTDNYITVNNFTHLQSIQLPNNNVLNNNNIFKYDNKLFEKLNTQGVTNFDSAFLYNYTFNSNLNKWYMNNDVDDNKYESLYDYVNNSIILSSGVCLNEQDENIACIFYSENNGENWHLAKFIYDVDNISIHNKTIDKIRCIKYIINNYVACCEGYIDNSKRYDIIFTSNDGKTWTYHDYPAFYDHTNLTINTIEYGNISDNISLYYQSNDNNFNNIITNKEIIIIGGYVNSQPAGPNQNDNLGSALMYTFDNTSNWYNKRHTFQSCLLSKNNYINSFNQYDNSEIICKIYEIKFINNIFIATMGYHNINIDSGIVYYIIRSTNGIVWDLYGPLNNYITFTDNKINKSIIAYEDFKIIIYSNSHNYCLISYDQGITWNLNSTSKKINKAFNFSNNDIITYYTYKDDDVKYKLGISEHSNNVLNYNPTLNYDNNDVIEKIDEVLYNGKNVIGLKEFDSTIISVNTSELNDIKGLNEKKYSGDYLNDRYWFDGRAYYDSGITNSVYKDEALPPPTTEWRWPAEYNVISNDYHPGYQNGLIPLGGAGGEGASANGYGQHGIANTGDPTRSNIYHSNTSYGTSNGYIDLLFEFETNTWVSGWRQVGEPGHIGHGDFRQWKCYVNGFIVYVGGSDQKDTRPNGGASSSNGWTYIGSYSHGVDEHGPRNYSKVPFPHSKSTTTWESVPCKYLLIRITSNHGESHGRHFITIAQMQIKFASAPTYSYNWTGYLTPNISGIWNFRTISNKTSNLWLDDIHVVNNDGTSSQDGSMNLISGVNYALQITGGESMHFEWWNSIIGITSDLNSSSAGIIFTTETPPYFVNPLPYNFLKGPSDLYFPEKKNDFYNKNNYFSSGIKYENIEEAFFGSQELYSILPKNSVNAIPSMFIDTNYESNFKYRYNENNMNIVACVGNDVTYCDNNKLNKYNNQIVYEWKDGSSKDNYKLSSNGNINCIFNSTSELNLYMRPKNNNYGYENLHRISDRAEDSLIKSLSNNGPKLSNMFSHAYAWNNGKEPGIVNTLGWKISSSLNCNNMFYRCFSMNTKFKYPFIIGSNANNMFNSCINYNNGYNYYEKNTSKLDFENIHEANSLFSNCYLLNLNLNKIILPNIKNLEYAFQNCFFLDTDLSQIIKNIRNKKNLNIKGFITNTNLNEDNYSKLLFEIIASIPNEIDYKIPTNYNDYFNISTSSTGINNGINTNDYNLSNNTTDSLPWSNGTHLSDINNLLELWNIGTTLNYKLIQFVKDTKYNSSDSEKIKFYHLGIYGYNSVFFADPLYEMLYHNTVKKESKANLDNLAEVYYPKQTTFIHAYIFHNANEENTISNNINSGFGDDKGYGISNNGIIGYYNANQILNNGSIGLNNIPMGSYLNEENYNNYSHSLSIEAYIGRQDLIGINTLYNIDNANDCFWDFSSNKHLLEPILSPDIDNNIINFENIYKLTNYTNEVINFTLNEYLNLDSEVILTWKNVISFIDITWFDNLYYTWTDGGILNKDIKMKTQTGAYLLYSDDGNNWYSFSDNIHGNFYSKYIDDNIRNTNKTSYRRYLVPYHARYAKFTNYYGIPVKEIQLKKLTNIETIQRFPVKYKNLSNEIKYTHKFLRNGPKPKWSAAKFLQNSGNFSMIKNDLNYSGYSFIKLWDDYTNYRESCNNINNKHKYLVLNWDGSPTRMSIIYKNNTSESESNSIIRWAFSDDGERWYSNHDYYTNQNSYLHNNVNLNSTNLNNISLPPRAKFIMITTDNSKLFSLKSVILRGLITKNDIEIYMCNPNLKESYFFKSFGFNLNEFDNIGKINNNTLQTFTPFDNTTEHSRNPNAIWSFNKIYNKNYKNGLSPVKKLELNNDDFVQDINNVYYDSKAYINLLNFDYPFLNESDDEYIDPSNKSKHIVYIVKFAPHISPNTVSSNYKINRMIIQTQGSFRISFAVSADGNTWYDDNYIDTLNNVPYEIDFDHFHNNTTISPNIWNSGTKFIPIYLMLYCHTTSSDEKIEYLIPRLISDDTSNGLFESGFSKVYNNHIDIFNV